jgi:hypothetical protein
MTFALLEFAFSDSAFQVELFLKLPNPQKLTHKKVRSPQPQLDICPEDLSSFSLALCSRR